MMIESFEIHDFTWSVWWVEDPTKCRPCRCGKIAEFASLSGNQGYECLNCIIRGHIGALKSWQISERESNHPWAEKWVEGNVKVLKALKQFAIDHDRVDELL